MSAIFPSTSLRLSLSPAEWEACLDTWLDFAETTLCLPASGLRAQCQDADVLPVFLSSFYEAIAWPSSTDSHLNVEKAHRLRRLCFRVVKRLVTETQELSSKLLGLDFISAFCHVHLKSAALLSIIDTIWSKHGAQLGRLMQKWRTAIIAELDSQDLAQATTSLLHVAPLVHASPDVGTVIMTGSDFLDALVAAFDRVAVDAGRKTMANFLVLSLTGLTRTKPQSLTLLADHLYMLKTQADQSDPQNSLLASIVTNTSVLGILRREVVSVAPERLLKLLESLAAYQIPSLAWQSEKKRIRRTNKQKSEKAPHGTMQIHDMSLVTHIQDLFPDLGSAFVLKLLDEYHDDVEQAIAHLLEDSLPPHIASLDKTEQMPIHDARPETEIDHIVPRSTPPPPQALTNSSVPNYHTVYDNDDLLQLTHDTNRLHIGKAERHTSVPLDAASAASNKAAILSALAAFDADDDERDDTYDATDVGGTLDVAHPDGEPADSRTSASLASTRVSDADLALYQIYTANPAVFARTPDTRRGPARATLRAETHMTDEALEGWALMLQREPKRLARLEAATAAGTGFDGRQPALARAAYRDNGGDGSAEEIEGDSDTAIGSGDGQTASAARTDLGGLGHSRGGRGRGGRGRRGGRGDVAGTLNDAQTAHAQRRKEASKGRRANHNRRDQRARKMARGGGGVPA